MLASGSGGVSIPGVPEPSAALAVGIAAVVAAAGWKARALTGSGALTAALVGTAILLGAGWGGGVVLLAFFIAGSGVSRMLRQPPTEFDAKGDRRDPWQVLANGGAAAVGAWLARGQADLPLWIVTSSLAAAAADTWATAWGAGSEHPPRHILSGHSLPHGMSGGITRRGTLGGVAGGIAVAAVGAIAGGGAALLAAATVIGTASTLLDSVLGAVAQGRFRCPACQQPSERRIHRCGTQTLREGGWPWLGNDGVNAVATGAAALAGALAWHWGGSF